MVSRVYLSGKCNSVLDIYLNSKQLESGDTSQLYTKIAEAFPENDWVDLLCTYVNYKPKYPGFKLECHVTVY